MISDYIMSFPKTDLKDNQSWYHYCIHHGYINEDYDSRTNYRVFAQHPKLVQLFQSHIIDESHLPYLMGLQAKNKRLISENYPSRFSLELFDGCPSNDQPSNDQPSNDQPSNDQQSNEINIWLSIGNEQLTGPLYQIKNPSKEIKDRCEHELSSEMKSYILTEESTSAFIDIGRLPFLLNTSFDLSQEMASYEIEIDLGLNNDILTIDLTYHLKNVQIKGPSFEFVL